MLRIKAVEFAVALIAFTACVGSAMETSTPAAVQTTGTVTVTGRVTTSDGKPVANARVYVPGTAEATRTDANGNYTLTGVPGGPQAVVVRERGYVPVQVEAKFSTKPSDRARNHVNVKLLTPTEVATVTAQSARDSAALDKVGFFQRESSNRGAYFITPDQIAQMKPGTTSDIFRQVPVLVQASGRTGPVLRGAEGCLRTFVDGLPWRSMFPGDLDTYVPARDVVAAEVYPPGQIPPSQFVRGVPRSRCTTLAIWTRSRVG
jgi:iron complex outermembrane receptor protein